ncbi:MAG: ABC-2 transporter permease [Lachnospiraceae bacterium]|nr:ABC-2 transporter permease [Lachnospiraceae bacterium]
MKGLIIKDIMCLRKQLKTFTFVLIGVFVLAVMYVLSARFGNIAKAGADMLMDSELTAVDVKNIGSFVLILFMIIPMSAVLDMTIIFNADGEAGFNKIAGTLPLSIHKRLLARFLTIYALFLAGIVVDTVLAIVISSLTDMMNFGELMGVIVSAAAFFSIYGALIIFFNILLGYGKDQYCQFLAIFATVFGAALFNIRHLIKIWKVLFLEQELDFNVWGWLDYLKTKAWIVVIAAVLVSAASYGLSLYIADRKRGVI